MIGPSSSPTATFTYSLPLVQGTLNFGKVLDSPTAGTTLCIHLDMAFLVTPSEVRSRNTLVTYPPPTPLVRLSPNSQFLRTVTIYPTLYAASPPMDCRTFSTDSVLSDITDPTGHHHEGWIDSSVKSKHCIPLVMNGAKKRSLKE